MDFRGIVLLIVSGNMIAVEGGNILVIIMKLMQRFKTEWRPIASKCRNIMRKLYFALKTSQLSYEKLENQKWQKCC